MICKKVEITNEFGFHLRPATLFSHIAQQFHADIKVQYNGKTVEGRSIIGLLKLEVKKGGKLSIYIEGRDEADAMKALLGFMASEMN